MSNASSKPEHSSRRHISRLRHFLHSRHSGAWALGEFLLLGVLGALSSQLTAIHILQFFCLILLLIHSATTIRRRTWDPWFSLLSVLLIYFLAQAVAGAMVYIYPMAQGWSEAKATFWLNNSVTAQFAYFVLATGLSLGAVYGYLRLFRIKLSSIGIRRPRWGDLLYGLAAVPFYFIFYLLTVAVISHFVPGFDINQEQQLGFDNVSGVVQLTLTFISLVVLPPLMEEVMIRGLLYSSLKKALPIIVAVLLTSLIFAGAHLPEGGTSGPLYIAAVDTFVLSLVLIYLREKTGGLWASMTLHAIKNGIAFTALFILHVK